jgi:hypothetical protein
MTITDNLLLYSYYSMPQYSHNPKFKGKYFITVIGKFQFAARSFNSRLLSPQHVGGLTQVLRIRCSLESCLCNKHHVFLTMQRVFIVEHYLRTQSYKATNRHIMYNKHDIKLWAA